MRTASSKRVESTGERTNTEDDKKLILKSKAEPSKLFFTLQSIAMQCAALLLNASHSLKETAQLVRALELQARWSSVPLAPGEEMATIEAALRHRSDCAER